MSGVDPISGELIVGAQIMDYLLVLVVGMIMGWFLPKLMAAKPEEKESDSTGQGSSNKRRRRGTRVD